MDAEEAAKAVDAAKIFLVNTAHSVHQLLQLLAL